MPPVKTRRPPDLIERALIALYQAAARQAQTVLDEAIASGRLGSIRYRRARLTAIRAILATLTEPTTELVAGISADAYSFGADQVDELLNNRSFGGGMQAEAVRAIADNLTAQLGAARNTLGRRATDALRKEGLRQVALGLAGGDTRREISERLTAQLQRQGLTAFQDALGRSWKLDTYAEMVVRTTTREAASIGTRNRMLEHGLDLVDISEHPHQEHDVCDQYAGRTFSLTGRTEGYPLLDEMPPFHPNCRHVLTPSAKNLELLEERLGSL